MEEIQRNTTFDANENANLADSLFGELINGAVATDFVAKWTQWNVR